MKLANRTTKTKLSTVSNNDVLEFPFAQYLAYNKVNFIRQFKPIKDRKFKVDFYLPDYNVIIEIEGGQWIQGRHQRGIGFKLDIEKYNILAFAGYKVFRLTTDHFLKVGLKQYAVVGYSATLVKDIIGTWEPEKNG